MAGPHLGGACDTRGAEAGGGKWYLSLAQRVCGEWALVKLAAPVTGARLGETAHTARSRPTPVGVGAVLLIYNVTSHSREENRKECEGFWMESPLRALERPTIWPPSSRGLLAPQPRDPAWRSVRGLAFSYVLGLLPVISNVSTPRRERKSPDCSRAQLGASSQHPDQNTPTCGSARRQRPLRKLKTKREERRALVLVGLGQIS